MENNARKRTIELINKYGIVPQVRFSQNFLVDDKKIKKIISSIPLENIEQIIEIGPGIGSLTFPLLKTGKDLTVIEFDRDMIKVLEGEFGQNDVHIIQNDILKQDLSVFHVKHKAYIGNLPYQISRDLIKKILCETNFDYFGFMVQKELGEKLAYKFKSSNTNVFSLLLKLKGEIELVAELDPISFYPSPKIQSWFMKFIPNSDYDIDLETFDILAAIFKNPKKNIWNNLKQSKYKIQREDLEKIGVSPLKRSHELPIDDIKKIIAFVKSIN